MKTAVKFICIFRTLHSLWRARYFLNRNSKIHCSRYSDNENSTL